MPKPARLQHFALEVSDTDRAIAFYREVLGFKLTERHAAGEVEGIPVELTFLRLGNRHHDLVLVHNPAKRYRPRPTRPEEDAEGLPSFHHFAVECDSREDWLAMVEKIRALGVPVVRGPVLHSFADPRGDGSWGENEAIYILDPDGHRIEIFCDLATIDPDGVHRNARGERVPGTRSEEL
ncbi:MAG: VOC family protein [Alphaproteobacteria bacterium]|nr:MAG: VOC family protein [Alphaproteobacteria bacterium]